MATAKVLQAGYRRIGLVLADDPEQASDNLVRESLFDALVARAGGSPVRPLRIRPGDTGGALADWCGQARPDAVIGYADGVLGQLESAGVIGSDGMGFAALQVARSGKEVAGIIDPSDSLGALSVELADEMLRRGRFGPLANRTIRNLAPIWKEGRSLPRSQTSAPVRVTFGPERIAAVS
jgi:hypothetical protein